MAVGVTVVGDSVGCMVGVVVGEVGEPVGAELANVSIVASASRSTADAKVLMSQTESPRLVVD